MKKLKTFAFCTLLAALAANHTPATAANGPTGDAAPATRDSEPKMYAWEQERDAIPSYTDLVLCYGGSHHRTPYRWDKERFTPFVTYVDEEGREHWLFDGFLFLEFQDSSRPDGGKYAYMVGVLRGQGISAGKQQWKELIDYWFDGDNGVNALEAAVKEASQRLGTPPAKRKVVMVMPDPIIYQKYDDTSESTTYWGSLDGRRMDFAKGADRVAACKWYIDQVRRRFDEGNYQYVELAGFYPISEEIVTPGDGYCHELKKSEEVIPQVAEYLHSINQSFCWIPYNRAAGYTKWKEMGIDYAYMQPNHFFNHSIPDSRLDEACATARRHGMAMEFEFDEKATAAIPNSSHDRMAAYINHFEKNDVFNSSAVAYYCGNRGVLTLDESDNPKDKALMDRLARIIQARRYLKYGIPMKNKTRVVAHRGFWHTDGSAQNSIASLLKADQLGVYGVEFDVWMASDGVPVLNHDSWHDGYEVQSTPSTVLTTLKLENGEPMPTLAQYLEAAKDTKVHLVLELKPHATPEAETAAAEAVVKMVGRYGLSKRVTYISFSLHIMKELARLAPAKTQLMYLGGGTLPKDLKAMGLTGCDFNYGVYLNNPTWLNDIKALKMASNVWTVNNPADMMWAIENRVDFITTDRPDLFLKLTRK